MTWETKDVLMLVAAIGGVAAAWGIAQTKVAAIAAELRELKRDTQASLRSQGERLGKIETATVVAREVAKLVGRGTPPLGLVVDHLRGQRSGQVQQAVDDGSSADDDEQRR